MANKNYNTHLLSSMLNSLQNIDPTLRMYCHIFSNLCFICFLWFQNIYMRSVLYAYCIICILWLLQSKLDHESIKVVIRDKRSIYYTFLFFNSRLLTMWYHCDSPMIQAWKKYIPSTVHIDELFINFTDVTSKVSCISNIPFYHFKNSGCKRSNRLMYRCIRTYCITSLNDIRKVPFINYTHTSFIYTSIQ